MVFNLHNCISFRFPESRRHFHSKQNVWLFSAGVAHRGSARTKHIIASACVPRHRTDNCFTRHARYRSRCCRKFLPSIINVYSRIIAVIIFNLCDLYFVRFCVKSTRSSVIIRLSFTCKAVSISYGNSSSNNKLFGRTFRNNDSFRIIFLHSGSCLCPPPVTTCHHRLAMSCGKGNLHKSCHSLRIL